MISLFQTSISKAQSQLQPQPQAFKLGPKNGRLNIYSLPVGQGDAHVIQCPSGHLTIVDMGTSTKRGGFWDAQNIQVNMSTACG